MQRLATKRTTKNEAHLSRNTHVSCNGVWRAARRRSAVRSERRYVCRHFRVPTAVYVQRCADCEFARGTIGYHSNSWASCFTARYYAERIARVCRLSVCPWRVEVPWSHRLEYFENNFTAGLGLLYARADPNMGDLHGATGTLPKLGWNRGGAWA